MFHLWSPLEEIPNHVIHFLAQLFCSIICSFFHHNCTSFLKTLLWNRNMNGKLVYMQKLVSWDVKDATCLHSPILVKICIKTFSDIYFQRQHLKKVCVITIRNFLYLSSIRVDARLVSRMVVERCNLLSMICILCHGAVIKSKPDKWNFFKYILPF